MTKQHAKFGLQRKLKQRHTAMGVSIFGLKHRLLYHYWQEYEDMVVKMTKSKFSNSNTISPKDRVVQQKPKDFYLTTSETKNFFICNCLLGR